MTVYLCLLNAECLNDVLVLPAFTPLLMSTSEDEVDVVKLNFKEKIFSAYRRDL